MSRYDVVVIGSGMGGLTCAAMLAKEGMKVCVVEKNHRPGGCLQSVRAAGGELLCDARASRLHRSGGSV